MSKALGAFSTSKDTSVYGKVNEENSCHKQATKNKFRGP
jgi:hypothetical protein